MAAACTTNQQVEEEIAAPSVDAYLGSANGGTTSYGGHNNQHYVHDNPPGYMTMAATFPRNQQVEEEIAAPSVDAYLGSANGGTTSYGGHNNQHYVHDNPPGYMTMAATFPRNQQVEEEIAAPSVDAYLGSANGGTTSYGGHNNQHYVHDNPPGYMTMAATFPRNQQVEEEIAAPSVDAYLGSANGGTTSYDGHNQHYVHDNPPEYMVMAATFPRNRQVEEEITAPSVDAYLGSANGGTTTYGGHNQHYVHDNPSGYMIMAATFPTNQQVEEEIAASSVDAYLDLTNGDTTTYGGHNQHYVHDYPPGYRFCPTDVELVVHYLMKKVKNEPLPHNKIPILNIYQYNPYDLAAQYELLGEKEWYFFTQTDRKYPNGKYSNRVAGSGYWKATTGDKTIRDEGGVVGVKKSLVFYIGKPKNSNKTDWIMHEYRLDVPRMEGDGNIRLDNWVLCKIYENNRNQKKAKQQENQDEMVASSVEELTGSSMTQLISEFGPIEDSNQFINTSNYDCIEPPEVTQSSNPNLPNQRNLSVDHIHHRPMNHIYEDLQFDFESQIAPSTQRISNAEYLHQQNLDSNLRTLQNDYNS